MGIDIKDALIIVDVQVDFCPGGALAVKDGDQVVPLLNRYIERFRQCDSPIFATRDWHPAVTKHFKAYGGVWPVHCVQDTAGGAFYDRLALDGEVIIISKGTSAESDSYSGFDGVDDRGVPLAECLRQFGVEHIHVGGLATDYCVKHTVLDGLKLGFKVSLLEDAVRGVDLAAGDSARAIDAMVQAGAHLEQLG